MQRWRHTHMGDGVGGGDSLESWKLGHNNNSSALYVYYFTFVIGSIVLYGLNISIWFHASVRTEVRQGSRDLFTLWKIKEARL